MLRPRRGRAPDAGQDVPFAPGRGHGNGMAYSKAWTILKNAEEQLGFKLLLSTTGGKHGGGAQLTEQGEALLAAYARYCQTLRDFAQRQFAADFADFL